MTLRKTKPWEGMSMSQAKRVYWLPFNSRGQTVAEYALIVATVAVICIALVNSAGTIVTSIVNNVISLF
jgi:Flp pilus assembly pilin Flp